MVGADFFKPKHIVIATWKNVSFAGGIVSARRIVSSFNAYLRTKVRFYGTIFDTFEHIVVRCVPSVSSRNIFCMALKDSSTAKKRLLYSSR